MQCSHLSNNRIKGKTGVAVFYILYITMHIKKAFKCIEIPLNHRLLRRLIKDLRVYIKENNITSYNHYNCIMAYNYLRRMWKHKNSQRFVSSFVEWKHYRFDKQITNRKIYFEYDWYICLERTHICETDCKLISKDYNNIKQILKWYFSERNNIPF